MPVRRWVLVAVLLPPGCLLADLPDAEPSRDFLRRPSLGQYTNYGEDLYRPYRREIRLEPRYDFLGNFLAEGFLLYELDEQRPGRSHIRKGQLYRSLNNLIIAHDAYGPWNWSLTVGDEVRTQFTPLTLRQAGFSGMRWDLVFPGNKVTLLTSRGFDSSLFPTLDTFSSPVRQGQGILVDFLVREEENPVYNFAGHWQTRLGDVLRFGATLVNQHQVNTARGSKGRFLRGSIPYPEMQPPVEISVRIMDDSPLSAAAGAVVYDVSIELEGEGPEGMAVVSSDRTTPTSTGPCSRGSRAAGAATASGRCAAGTRRWNTSSRCRRTSRPGGRRSGRPWPTTTASKRRSGICSSTPSAISSCRATPPTRPRCGPRER